MPPISQNNGSKTGKNSTSALAPASEHLERYRQKEHLERFPTRLPSHTAADAGESRPAREGPKRKTMGAD
jgi:hypothetical protein